MITSLCFLVICSCEYEKVSNIIIFYIAVLIKKSSNRVVGYLPISAVSAALITFG